MYNIKIVNNYSFSLLYPKYKNDRDKNTHTADLSSRQRGVLATTITVESDRLIFRVWSGTPVGACCQLQCDLDSG